MILNTGQRVDILAGDEKGGWGTFIGLDGDAYHVAPYGGSDLRIYDVSEIRPTYYIQRRTFECYAIMRVGKRGGSRWIISYKDLSVAQWMLTQLLDAESNEVGR